MDDVIDPNASKEVAMTSLDWCARSRQLRLLNAVLSAHFSNCAISDLERECNHVLRNAVTSGCKDTLTSLLRHVDDAFLHQCQDPEGSGDVSKGRTRLQKLLGLAVAQGHRDVAEVLLRKGADVNSTYHNKPLLHLSLSLGHHHLALLLVEHGADVNMTDGKGETPIFAALSLDNEGMNDVTDDLIRRGADVNHRSLTGRQPLHCAALTANSRAVHRLVEEGCDVSAKDSILGDTALHVACSRCCPDAVVTLIRHGADLNSVNQNGETPLRKLLQHATRVSKDFHHNTRIKLARRLITLGFHLLPFDQRQLPPVTTPSGIEKTTDSHTQFPDRCYTQTKLHQPSRKEQVQTGQVSNSQDEHGFRTSLSPAHKDTRATKRNGHWTNSSRGSGSRGHRRDKVMEVFQSLKSERMGVPGLQHLCRMEIRRHLPAVRFQKSVKQLEISPQLHQYLMFLPQLFDDTLY